MICVKLTNFLTGLTTQYKIAIVKATKFIKLLNISKNMVMANKLNKDKIKKDLPEIEPGYTVIVHQKIKEGEKERIQKFEGLVLGKKGRNGLSATITVRKISEGIGVEKIFPLHSPLITKIEVTRKARVRRAKLNYVRTYKKRLKEKKVKTKK